MDPPSFALLGKSKFVGADGASMKI
jgi:hypothetical protein